MENMEKEQIYKASVGPYANYMHRSCLNCGAMTHITKWCLERPRKISKSPNTAPKENIFSFTLDFNGKQDPSNGYDAASFENKDGDALKGDDKYTAFGKALRFKQLNIHALKAFKNKKNTQLLAASLSELYYSRVADTMMGKYDYAASGQKIPRELLLKRIETQVAYDLGGRIIKGQEALLPGSKYEAATDLMNGNSAGEVVYEETPAQAEETRLVTRGADVSDNLFLDQKLIPKALKKEGENKESGEQ